MNREQFELLAEKYQLDLNRNEHNYLDYRTQAFWEFCELGWNKAIEKCADHIVDTVYSCSCCWSEDEQIAYDQGVHDSAEAIKKLGDIQ